MSAASREEAAACDFGGFPSQIAIRMAFYFSRRDELVQHLQAEKANAH